MGNDRHFLEVMFDAELVPGITKRATNRTKFNLFSELPSTAWDKC